MSRKLILSHNSCGKRWALVAETARLRSVVWQHNRLAEARYELTAREQKLLLYVIAMIELEDEQLKRYVVNVAEFEYLETLSPPKRTELEIAAIMASPLGRGQISLRLRQSIIDHYVLDILDGLQPKCKRVTLSKVSARVSNIPGMIHPDVFRGLLLGLSVLL
jgi:hypothetical protein